MAKSPITEATPTTEEQIAALERLRDEAERKVAEVKAAINSLRAKERDSVEIIERYEIKRYVDKSRWCRVFDETCVVYSIRRRIVNRDACLEAGHAEHMLGEGSMNYLFNTSTGKLIMPVSGGTSYLSDPMFSTRVGAGESILDGTMARIGEYLVENPDGGDITAIVQQHRAAVALIDSVNR